VLGLTMTLNPVFIFLSLAVWTWVCGPAGGSVAVPFLLIVQVVIGHLRPVESPTT
jgi:predicted PurR-regulated permease PerM